MGRLEGKVAIVTGGGKGIGKGIAIRFAAEGASVAIAQRDESTLEETAARIADAGGKALAIPTDITDPSSVADLINATVRELGPVDILVNNAAIAGSHGNFLETTLEVWESYMKTNLTGTFLMTQAVARGMVDAGTKGRIINIGSIQSFVAQPGFTAYGTSKGGVLMFTRLLAKDLASHRITVNLIAPGPIKVERNVEMHESERFRGIVDQFVLAGRSGLPEDCAAAAVYLASDESEFVTGTSITVDGGVTASLPF